MNKERANSLSTGEVETKKILLRRIFLMSAQRFEL
jgi:hypothetical protein